MPFGTVPIRVEGGWIDCIRLLSVLVVELGCLSWCLGAVFCVFGQICGFLGRASKLLFYSQQVLGVELGKYYIGELVTSFRFVGLYLGIEKNERRKLGLKTKRVTVTC